MKNKFTFIFAILILTAAVLGCSSLDGLRGSKDDAPPVKRDEVAVKKEQLETKDKTLSDRAVDVAVGEKTTGVPECDEVFAFFDNEMNNADDDFVTKATKKTIFNVIKEQIKTGLEEKSSDKKQMAKTCSEYLEQLKTQKAAESEK